MPNAIPTPVAAALGLVPTVLDSARRIPTKIIQIPVLAVSTALTALNTWQQEYEALADRGERLISQLRGQSPDDLEGQVDEWLAAPTETEELLEDTPLATPVEIVAAQAPLSPPGSDGEDYEAQVTSLLDRAASRPKGKSTPSAPTGTPAKHDTAVTEEVLAAVDEALASVEIASPTHDTLPLPDYDHMTLGSLRGRLRSLSVEELGAVRDYEKSHADRLPVVTLLDNRIAKLALDAGATPSPGGELPVLPTADSAPEKAVKKAPAKKAPATKVRKS